MKRVFTLFAALILLMSAVPYMAGAACDRITYEPVNEIKFEDIADEMTVFTIANKSDHDVNLTITVYDQVARINVQTIKVTILKGDAPLPIKTKIYKELAKKGDLNTYRYTIESDNGYKKRLYYAQVLTDDVNKLYTQYRNTFYGNNSASSFGPHFRDMNPKMTDLWYMFTPINLSIQGRQTFELVASNIYVIGEVYVDVYGDSVTVSYHNYYDGKGGSTVTKQEFLNFFGSYQEAVIPNDDPAKNFINPPTKFAFNRPFSIQRDLNGDTNVLMLVRNVVDYWRFPTPTRQFRRFWENTPDNSARRNNMLMMMDQTPSAEGLTEITDK